MRAYVLSSSTGVVRVVPKYLAQKDPPPHRTTIHQFCSRPRRARPEAGPFRDGPHSSAMLQLFRLQLLSVLEPLQLTQTSPVPILLCWSPCWRTTCLVQSTVLRFSGGAISGEIISLSAAHLLWSTCSDTRVPHLNEDAPP